MFTTVGVAVVAYLIDDLSWAAAFVLGAIVSPTDPLAATSIASRFGVPRKLVTIVEGEPGQRRDRVVLYRVAVAAVIAGSFSAWYTGGLFLVVAGGGIAFGLAVGWLMRQVRRRLDESPRGDHAVAAERVHRLHSGGHDRCLSCPRCSHGRRLPGMAHARAHDRAGSAPGIAVWEIVQYALNALLFVLIGLQLPVVVDALGFSTATLLGWAAVVSGTVIALRFAWVFVVLQAPKWIGRMSSWRSAVFVSWAGMRGAVSLAAALALPLATDDGAPFPGRDLILFLTFSVILATLVGMGLTLPAVIRLVGLEDDGAERGRTRKRAFVLQAALAEARGARRRGVGARGHRRARSRPVPLPAPIFRARLDDGDDGEIGARSQDFQRLRRELLDAEREALVDLRRIGAISNDVWLRVGRDLDLEDQRLDA